MSRGAVGPISVMRGLNDAANERPLTPGRRYVCTNNFQWIFRYNDVIDNVNILILFLQYSVSERIYAFTHI